MEDVNVNKECENGGQYNPSFPCDVEVDKSGIRGDAIGNTLYSERWVIKILMKLVKLCDEEWTDEFETELCLLWDMTMDADVVNLLMQHGFLQIASQIIKTTAVPRLTEIMVGILGNMSCVQQVRVDVSRDSDTISLLLDLLSMPDAPVLVQLTRLIQTCAWNLRNSSETEESLWLKHLCDDNKWIDSLSFILTSSTNKELLVSTLALLETLCSHDTLATRLINADMLSAVIEATKQLQQACEKYDSDLEKAICHSGKIVSDFTSTSEGRRILAEHATPVRDMLYMHLKKISLDLISEQQLAFILAAVTVMGTIFDICRQFDFDIFNCFLMYLTHFKDGNEEHAEVVDNLAQYFRLVVQEADDKLLAAVLQDCSATRVQVLQDIMNK